MPAGSAADFIAACKATGLTTITFVRHASSAPMREGASKRSDAPHSWKSDDQMRCLTKKGEVQCEVASKSWFKNLPLRAILSSPARRAAETAMRMMSAYETEDSKQEALYLRMVESSHPAGMSELCEGLFETLGYGPLRKFFAAEGGEQAFMDYGDRVCEEISRTMTGPAFSSENDDKPGTCLALFGHAVFLNAIAYKVAQASGSSAEMKDFLLDMDLGETEGITIYIDTGVCVKNTVVEEKVEEKVVVEEEKAEESVEKVTEGVEKVAVA